MFVSGGQPGLAKDLQVQVAAARKVFRFMKVRLPWIGHDNPLSVHMHQNRCKSSSFYAVMYSLKSVQAL